MIQTIHQRGSRPNSRSLRSAIEAEFDRQVELCQEQYLQITSTWNNPVTFRAFNESSGRDRTVRVYASGSRANIFRFLDRGTSVRYATMSHDFVPKTTRRSLRSGPGRGRMLYVSRAHPRPGIKAREFTEAVAEVRRRPFAQEMRRAFQRSFR